MALVRQQVGRCLAALVEVVLVVTHAAAAVALHTLVSMVTLLQISVWCLAALAVIGPAVAVQVVAH